MISFTYNEQINIMNNISTYEAANILSTIVKIDWIQSLTKNIALTMKCISMK